MAIDKDPSIFTDRSTIGSSDELDEYGVWVKSEPKDVSDTMNSNETAGMDSLLEDSFEPSLPDIEDLPDLEMDTLSELEPNKEAEPESLPEMGNLPEPEDFSVEELPQASDTNASFEEVSSFDDIDFASFEESAVTTEKVEETKQVDEKKSTGSSDFTELSMDDFLDTESSASETGPEQEQTEEEPFDIDLEFNESVDLNMMSAESAMDIGTVSEAKDADLNIETVSDFDDFLSDLGEEAETDSEIKEASSTETASETREKPADFNDIEAVHKELEEAAVSAESIHDTPPVQEAKGGTSVDLSTQLLMKIADELSSIKKELSTLKEELAVYKGSVPTISQEEAEPKEKVKGFFDDEEDEKIALTGDELDNILNTAEFTEESGSVITDVEETSLLENPLETSEIETETPVDETTSDLLDSSIQSEGSIELDKSFQLDENEFLSDKENIISDEIIEETPQETLKKAEFEEEAIAEIQLEEPPTEEESEEGASEEPEIELSDITSDTAFDTSSDSETAAFEEIVELPVDENIAALQEEGVTPITEAPEDVSYLEEELNTENADISHLDLSEAVIEEPDLSGIVLEEHPLEEPAIEDIHIDLETEEVLHIEDQEAPGSTVDEIEEDNLEVLDLDLGIEASTEDQGTGVELAPELPETLPSFEELEEMPPIQEESFEEVLPEGFVVEAEEAEPFSPSSTPVEEEVLETIPEVEETPLEPSEPSQPSDEKEKVVGTSDLTQEIKAVLSYMDQLLESLPEEKIEEFAKSEYFETYKKLFEELGLA
ncbi:MAG TPA: hypothetical protein P5336_07665 [Treponema sp.]|nr:hypothetical protein [Treponema sp.]